MLNVIKESQKYKDLGKDFMISRGHKELLWGWNIKPVLVTKYLSLSFAFLAQINFVERNEWFVITLNVGLVTK